MTTTLNLVIEVPDESVQIVTDSAESALREAQGWGSVTGWRWSDSNVSPDGQPTSETNYVEEAVAKVRGGIADTLEQAADLVRGAS